MSPPISLLPLLPHVQTGLQPGESWPVMLPGAGWLFGAPLFQSCWDPRILELLSCRNAIVLPPPASLGIDANFSLWSLTHSLLLPDSEGGLGFLLNPLSVGNCGGHHFTSILVGLAGQGWRKEQRGKFNRFFFTSP